MTKERKFVIGDIHSHYNEMIELFEMVNFDFHNDILISLGDLVDRGQKPIEVIEKLMEIKNFIHILGNHDEWCLQYLKTNRIPKEWKSQGGKHTLEEYQKFPHLWEKHIRFFEKAKLFFIDPASRLFVHGGYNPRIPFYRQQEDKDILLWDRSLVLTAMEYHQTDEIFDEFREIFIGHTPTLLIGDSAPKHFANLWMLDTGVHISGKLTLMDIDTKEYWQSEMVNDT